MLNIENKILHTKYMDFRTKVLGMPEGAVEKASDLVLLRNIRVMRVAALLVFITDIFWLITNIAAPETDKLYSGFVLISGYIHIFLAALMTFVSFITRKITTKNRGFLNCVFLVFYLYTIYHVTLYAINFDDRAMTAGANSDFVGIALSTFYLFVIAFAPMDEWYYTLLLGILTLLGDVMPMLTESAEYYAGVEQGLLRLFLVAAYLLIRKINRQLAEHEIYLIQVNEDLMLSSYVDDLTNVLNRRSMDAYWEYMSEDLQIKKVGVMLYDVDNFKNFNDTYSHLSGDKALCNVCTAVAEAITDEDGVYLFRYGGEEFVLLCQDPTVETLSKLAGKIVKSVYDMNMPRSDIEGRDRVTITLGCAIISVEEVTSEDYIKAADKQTYIGKHSGKNCYVLDGEINRVV